MDNIDYTSSQISALKIALKMTNNNNYDYVLIDTAGSASNDVIKATSLMTHIVIPMQSSLLDINSTKSLLEAMQAYKIYVPFKILINEVSPSSTSIVKDLQEYFIQNKIDTFNSYICYRKSYKDSIYNGQSIIETLPAKDNGLIEFNFFMEELENWIK